MKKTFISLLALAAAVALTGTVRADVGVVAFTNNATCYSNVALSAGFADVSIANQDEVGFQLSFGATAAGTGTMTVILARSMDGTTFETAPRMTFAIAATGTTKAVLYTNLTSTWVGSAKALRCISISNGSAEAGLNYTNVTASICLKRLR